MKNIPILLTAILLHVSEATDLSAQIDFFPDNAEWHYAFTSFGLIKSRGYTIYQYTGDTIILSTAVYILKRTTYYVDFDDPTIPLDTVVLNPLFMTQQGDSVLYYNGEQFQLLWRTNPQVGDSYTFETQGGLFPYTMEVDSITPETISGIAMQKIWISGGTGWGQDGNALIYDRFGPAHGMTYYDCWGALDCTNIHLCRYINDSTGLVLIDGSYCDNFPLSAETIHPHTRCYVFPNPSSGLFTLRIPFQTSLTIPADIYSVESQHIGSITISTADMAIDLSHLSPGVYFCRIRLDTHVAMVKLIKF